MQKAYNLPSCQVHGNHCPKYGPIKIRFRVCFLLEYHITNFFALYKYLCTYRNIQKGKYLELKWIMLNEIDTSCVHV